MSDLLDRAKHTGRFAVLLTLSIAIAPVQAQVDALAKYRYTISKSGALVYDHFTNLVWQRCFVGQSYTNGTCQGKPTNVPTVDRSNAVAVARNVRNRPWRVPKFDELATIISCPSGISDAYRTGIPNLSGQLFGASFNPSVVFHSV